MKLKLIPPQKEGTVTNLKWEGKGEFECFIKGQGTISYRCGLCPQILIKNIEVGQVRKMTFRCPKCGSWNAIP